MLNVKGIHFIQTFNTLLKDIRFLGQTQHGVYDETDGVDPALLHRYYGAASNGSNSYPTSHAGPNSPNHPSTNSDDSSDSDDFSTSTSDTNSSSDSDTDSTSSTNNGSDSNEDSSSSDEGSSSSEGSGIEGGSQDRYPPSWQNIAETIANAQRRNIHHDAAEVAKSAAPLESADDMRAYILALGTALASNEYPAGFGLNEEYKSVESYKTGRSSKRLVIPLPYDVWFPRIVVWCKALDLLKRLPICRAAVVSE